MLSNTDQLINNFFGLGCCIISLIAVALAIWACTTSSEFKEKPEDLLVWNRGLLVQKEVELKKLQEQIYFQQEILPTIEKQARNGDLIAYQEYLSKKLNLDKLLEDKKFLESTIKYLQKEIDKAQV